MKDLLNEYIKKILTTAGFSNFQIEIQTDERDKKIRVNVKLQDSENQKGTRDSGLLIGHQGEVLGAWEKLLSVLIQRKKGELWRVNFDVNNYRMIYEEKLREVARKAARQVILSQRALELPPMSAKDRRVIHLEIALKSGVQSKSIGEGKERRVVISPEEPF